MLAPEPMLETNLFVLEPDLEAVTDRSRANGSLAFGRCRAGRLDAFPRMDRIGQPLQRPYTASQRNAQRARLQADRRIGAG